MTRWLIVLMLMCAPGFGPAFAEFREDARYTEAYTLLGVEDNSPIPEDGTPATDRAIALLQELDAEGYANASNLLGVLYQNGLAGVQQDLDTAILHFERASETSDGNIQAASYFNLAGALARRAEYGSEEWLRVEEIASKLVDLPDFGPGARGIIGEAMLMGPGEPRYEEALPNLLAGLTAEAPDLSLHWLLARGYSAGWFGEHSMELACPHFLGAAEYGIDAAFWRTGMCYLNGTGLPKDSAEAYAWVARSADAGFEDGMISRAVMLATGDGVAEDDAEAMHWYSVVISMGGEYQPHALRSLGAMHLTGEAGERSDFAVGLAMVELAEEGGDEIASGFAAHYGADLSIEDRTLVNAEKARIRKQLSIGKT